MMPSAITVSRGGLGETLGFCAKAEAFDLSQCGLVLTALNLI